MMTGAGPEGQEIVETPRELIPRMGVNGLEEAANDPEVHREDM